MGIEAAIIGSALVGGVASSSAARSAAKSQSASTDAAINEQQRQFDLIREDQAPYRAAGASALQTLQGEIGRMPTAAEVMSQPGYQFGLDQGMQALARRQSAMGGRVSGAALKAATRYGTDYATSGYNAEYQRRQDRLNRLAALAGIGQTATQASAAAGQNMANQTGMMRTSLGDALGASRMAQGNIWGNTANQLSALYMRNNYNPQYGAGFGGIDQATGLPAWALDPYGGGG